MDPRLKSKWWRINHLYKILNKEGQLITFKCTRVQLMILAAMGRRLRIKILKYRQGGVTTLFCIYYLDDAIFTPGFSAGIIAHDQSTLDTIFEIVDRAFENLPESIKPITSRNTLRMLKFKQQNPKLGGQPLDSSIYVALKLRGGTVQALHVTERAYIEGDKSRELEGGSKQAVPMTGRITEETTGNGLNEYHETFTEAYNNPSDNPLDDLALFFAWHEDPQYSLPGKLGERTESDKVLDQLVFDHYGYHLTDGQIIWYNWKMEQLIKAARESDESVGLTGRQLMRQEYPSVLDEAFQSGLGNVFDLEILGRYVAAVPIRIMRAESPKCKGEKVEIFEEPVAGRSYFMGCDPSDGDGDPAAIAVWDSEYKKVAQWNGLLRPDKLAELVAEIGYFYNEAFAGVENNMLSTILFLIEIYQNYFVTVKVDEKRKTRTKKIGWTTSGKSRDTMIDDFVMHFEEETLQNLSATSLKQMRTFVRKEGGKREHASGKHDDQLFADFIAIQMIKYKDKSKTKRRTYANKPAGL